MLWRQIDYLDFFASISPQWENKEIERNYLVEIEI